MLRIVIPFVIASVLLTGCANERRRTSERIQQTDPPRTVPGTTAPRDRSKTAPVSPSQKRPEQVRENSIENKQAQQTAPKQSEIGSPQGKPSVTPLDQSGSEPDIAVTQRIRQALMREDLSFAAKNVLVITEPDHVVLKGQVRSASEAERVKGIAGMMTTKRIEDVLEVTP
jgi:osmotically-inducible protein OsmY